MYKYETHMHTSEASGCASSSGAEMAEKYKELGYTGIIVTDHFFNGNSAIDRSLPWEQMVDGFCRGYENAKKRGDEIGLSVFFGWEYTFDGTDILTYGLDRQWLCSHPETMSLNIIDYIRLVKRSGGLAIQAHPFRERDYIRMIRLFPRWIDGMETYNASDAGSMSNELAAHVARSYGLAETSGSDSHSINGINCGGMMFENKLSDIDDFISQVKSKSGVLLK